MCDMEPCIEHLLAAAVRMRSTSAVGIAEWSSLRFVSREPGVGREAASSLGVTSEGPGAELDPQQLMVRLAIMGR